MWSILLWFILFSILRRFYLNALNFFFFSWSIMGQKSHSALLANCTKKITAVLWVKTLKRFELKLLQFKICHLCWNRRTSKHSPTSIHTSGNHFLPLFGLCHLLPILPCNPCSCCPPPPLLRRRWGYAVVSLGGRWEGAVSLSLCFPSTHL